ncbi:replication initiation protein [Enterovibrio paralichthyis]|uniref:replication initiation protein n=1 Tax=Enterovibrio paralichthyis TaxID=2853805 RepID=UPI001C43BA34|nr:replication initiation protein [Enterovibrio paralichthyis]MBV7300260.1 replication initiation protein [Enterovibrio paralichthyis]
MSNTAIAKGPQFNRFSIENTPFHRLLEHAPFVSRCSDNKTATNLRRRDFAIRWPYMQVNSQVMKSWLVFDLDHANSWIWKDKGFPEPNLIVTNPANGKSHLFYAITPVCISNKARQKPIDFMQKVYRAMVDAFDADPDYSGPVAKTPGHPWWLTTEFHAQEYELSELADYCDFPEIEPWGRSAPDLDGVSHSRHCTLFEQLRFYAYSIVNGMRQTARYVDFLTHLESYAFNLNNFQKRGFDYDLPYSSVRATAKSVARWTWHKYTGDGRCHRGVMALDSSLPLSVKQKLAAKRTHQKRTERTERRIRAAAKQLKEAGKEITASAVSRAANVCRQTVSKYMHVLEAIITLPSDVSNVIPLSQILRRVNDVNYATHQVTPRLGKDLLQVDSSSESVSSPPKPGDPPDSSDDGVT